MRLDLFTRKNGVWTCYVQAITPVNAKRVIAALEDSAEHVAAFRHSKSLGRMVYQTGDGWTPSAAT